MKISVVIPVYNGANTLANAIESCLNQTIQPHEIIVVDDASSDNSKAVAEKYKQVKLISLSVNSGPSTARNKGWDEATGELVAFLDSDDIWHPEKLGVINSVFEDYGHIQYLGHSYTLDDFAEINKEALSVSHQTYFATILRNPYQPSCITVRKAISDRFDESYRYCEDHELSIRIAHKYATHWLNLPLTKLGRPQLSEGGASGNKWKMRKGELRLYTSIYKHSLLYAVLIPFLWIYSFCKMAYRSLK